MSENVLTKSDMADGCLDDLMAGDRLAEAEILQSRGCVVSEESEGWA